MKMNVYIRGFVFDTKQPTLRNAYLLNTGRSHSIQTVEKKFGQKLSKNIKKKLENQK